MPGIQLCIRKKGEILFSKAYGVANLDTKEPLTTKHLGHFASHSKMFTSCLLHRLQAQGALHLSDKITTYLPELKKHKDKRFREIRLQDLLSHRSGINRDGRDCGFWELSTPFPNRTMLIQEILASSLIYDPGTVTKYSNVGFSLLGLAIDAATGHDYAALMQREILDPLHLIRTEPDYTGNIKQAYADGHMRAFVKDMDFVLPHISANAMVSATGFCSTAEDMSAFLHGFVESDKLLDKTAQRDLLSTSWPIANSTTEKYGFGIASDQDGNSTTIGHDGGYHGFSSCTKYCDKLGLTISLCVNTNSLASSISGGALLGLAHIIDKINAAFSQKEAAEAIVSPVMSNLWYASLYIVGKQKALHIEAESWDPIKSYCLELPRKGKAYMTPHNNGYGVLNEAVFFEMKNGAISAIQYGCDHLIPVTAFKAELLKKGRKTSSVPPKD